MGVGVTDAGAGASVFGVTDGQAGSMQRVKRASRPKSTWLMCSAAGAATAACGLLNAWRSALSRLQAVSNRPPTNAAAMYTCLLRLTATPAR